MTRPTIRRMVTEDLQYCCLWFFFTRFRRTRVIADRLGVSPQAVRKCRAECGECQGHAECLDKVVTLHLTLRRSPKD